MTWVTTKKLLASNFAKYSLLVPLVGWLVVYNGEFQMFLSQALGVPFDETAATDWRILAFYLGLVLIGISSGLFRAACPPEVLEHDGLGGFLDDTTSNLTEARFVELCKNYIVDLPEFRGPDTVGFDQSGFMSREQWLRIRAEDIYNVLSDRYTGQISARPVWLGVTLIFFWFGAVITLIPTITTVWWVLVELSAQMTS